MPLNKACYEPEGKWFLFICFMLFVFSSLPEHARKKKEHIPFFRDRELEFAGNTLSTRFLSGLGLSMVNSSSQAIYLRVNRCRLVYIYLPIHSSNYHFLSNKYILNTYSTVPSVRPWAHPEGNSWRHVSNRENECLGILPPYLELGWTHPLLKHVKGGEVFYNL